MILQAFYYLIYCLSESKGMPNKMCNLKQIPFYLAMKRKKIFKNQLKVLVGFVCLFLVTKNIVSIRKSVWWYFIQQHLERDRCSVP